MKYSRNGECWCGSKKKYKQCHYDFDLKIIDFKMKGCITPSKEIIKNKKEIELIKESAKINTMVLDEVARYIKVGMSTAEIDKIVYDFTISRQAIPAPLNYDGYPYSVCTSINDEVCHGMPSESRLIQEGDIINVDVSTIYKGYFSDASRMFMMGKVSVEAEKLVEVTQKSLDAGLAAIKPWGFLGDVSEAVMNVARANGYSVVTKFGGHGVGKAFHEEPFVSHVGFAGTGMILAPGMIFTIEPMLNEGSNDVVIDKDNGWTVTTLDHKLSAQWENMVLITEHGYEILSK